MKLLSALDRPLVPAFAAGASFASTITSNDGSASRQQLNGHTVYNDDAAMGYDEDGISVLTGDARYPPELRDDEDDDEVDTSPSHRTVALRAAELSFQSTGGLEGEKERYVAMMDDGISL